MSDKYVHLTWEGKFWVGLKVIYWTNRNLEIYKEFKFKIKCCYDEFLNIHTHGSWNQYIILNFKKKDVFYLVYVFDFSACITNILNFITGHIFFIAIFETDLSIHQLLIQITDDIVLNSGFCL